MSYWKDALKALYAKLLQTDAKVQATPLSKKVNAEAEKDLGPLVK